VRVRVRSSSSVVDEDDERMGGHVVCRGYVAVARARERFQTFFAIGRGYIDR